MDSFQLAIVNDAIAFADALRLPENADILPLWLNHKPEHDILDAMFYSEERRAEWKRMFDEEMPANVLTAEQYVRLTAIEHKIDEKSGHSGSSWGYMVLFTKVILGKPRNHMYMNWINQAEEVRAGSTEPLSADDIATNKRVVMSGNDAYLYNDVTKQYDLVEPAEVQ